MGRDGTTTGFAESALVALGGLFSSAASEQYLGEEVTQAHHMLQAAALARRAGAADALVAAALLHDVGHIHPGPGEERHSDDGAALLSGWFGPEVTEPVRLHVAAKRYLCAVEPAYYDLLSAESVRTLGHQGGPMTAAQVRAYGAEPYGRDAVRVRRWDDEAKDPAARVPEFGHYRELLAGLVREGGSAPAS
jgi:gamma-butyrobetaine dioxygenase